MTGITWIQTLFFTRRSLMSTWSMLAALVRLAAVAFIFVSLGWILNARSSPQFKSRHPLVPEHIPPWNRTDSVIFLKAACFLDPDFQNRTLNGTHFKEAIGLQENREDPKEWIVFLALASLSGIAVVYLTIKAGLTHYRWYQYGAKRNELEGELKDEPPSLTLGPCRTSMGLCVVLWLAYAVFTILSAKNVFEIRRWVDQSGWLKLDETGNPETGTAGFGQTLAMVSAAAAVLPILESIKKRTKKEATQGGHSVKSFTPPTGANPSLPMHQQPNHLPLHMNQHPTYNYPPRYANQRPANYHPPPQMHQPPHNNYQPQYAPQRSTEHYPPPAYNTGGYPRYDQNMRPAGAPRVPPFWGASY